MRRIVLLIALAVSAFTYAQFPVTGVVVDAQGEALPGVNVQIKGDKKGTITNVAGKFNVNVPGGNSVLVFTYVGYEKKEIKPEKNKDLKVVLTESSHAE